MSLDAGSGTAKPGQQPMEFNDSAAGSVRRWSKATRTSLPLLQATRGQTIAFASCGSATPERSTAETLSRPLI